MSPSLLMSGGLSAHAGSGWAVAAGMAAASALALLLTTPRLRFRERIRATGGRHSVNGGVGPAPEQRRRAWPVPLGGAVLLGGIGAAGLQGPHLAVLLTAAVAAVAGARLAATAARARAAAERRHAVIDYCEALVGELRAGQPLGRAVERSVEVWPESEQVAAAAALGADVPEALRRLGRLPGASGVTRLAGAWEICARTGAGLAFAAEQVLATARAEEATDRLVQAELASARATARLVTFLPLVVLVAAQGIGAEPWSFLLSTIPGAGCLAAGVALALAGLWWIDRIAVAAAEGR